MSKADEQIVNEVVRRIEKEWVGEGKTFLFGVKVLLSVNNKNGKCVARINLINHNYIVSRDIYPSPRAHGPLKIQYNLALWGFPKYETDKCENAIKLLDESLRLIVRSIDAERGLI